MSTLPIADSLLWILASVTFIIVLSVWSLVSICPNVVRV